MSEATERAREKLLKQGKIGPKLGIAHAALDYIEALEGPRFRCSGCGKESSHRGDLLAYHGKQTEQGQALCDGNPTDLHAEAKRKFEEAMK